MLRKVVGNNCEKALVGVASSLHRHKITPNILTVTGLIINILGAYAYYQGSIVIGGTVILLAGLFDMLDGAVARAGEKVSKIGAFTDSVVDRYSDFIILGGVFAYFARNGDFAETVLVLVTVCGTFLVSYTRARAELVIPKCDVGLMERPERIIVLASGSIFNFLNVALWLLAILTHLTAFHRIYYTYRVQKKTPQ